MRATRIRLLGLVCATLSISVAAPALAATPAPLPGCDRLVLSPGFANDRTAYCAGLDFAANRFRLYVTHDRARTWTEPTATGLPPATTRLTDFVISPLFQYDRLLVATFSAGVYYSTDAGANFRPAPLVNAPVTLVPAAPSLAGADALVGIQAHSVILAVGNRPEPGASGSVVFDPVLPSVRVVAGTDAIDRAFVVSPDFVHDQKAFAVGATGSAPDSTTETLYSCDVAFTCRTKLHSFPARQSVDRIWFAADYATSSTLYATTVDVFTVRPSTYVSTNGGQTFSPIPTIQSAIADVHRAGARPAVVFAPGRAGTRTVFARVSAGVSAPNPPAERLYRTDDGGRRWVLVAYGRLPGAKGPRGSMPYAYGYATSESMPTPTGLLISAPDDRLLMTGVWWARGRTVWCSTDRGRTWSPRCP
jgi:hypothetical protein